MPLRVKVLWLFIVWLALEVALLSLLVKLVGWLAVLVLGTCTTLIGLSQLRQLGRRAFEGLRAGAPMGEGGVSDIVGGSVRAAGALFLIVPGFLTDALGVLLFIPAVRNLLSRLLPTVTTARTGTIDLDEHEWRRTDPTPPETISRLKSPG